MIFTGKNLLLVREGVVLALLELQTQIGSCPDVVVHEEYLDDLDAEVESYTKLLARIDRAIEKENS